MQREHVARVEFELRGLQLEQRRQQHPRAGEQHEGCGDLHDGEELQPPIGTGRQPRASVREAEPARRFRRRQSRHKCEQRRCDQREADANPEHARIDGDIERTHGEPRGVLRQHRDHRARHEHAEHCTGSAEQQALGEQRAAKRARPCTECGADGKLAFAPHRASQDQIRDVRARDDEDERRRGEQNQQDRSRRRDDLIAKLHRIDPVVSLGRVDLGILAHDRAMRGAQIGACGLDVGAGRETPEQLGHPMHASCDHRGRHVMGARDDVGDDLGFGGIGHRRLEDADDCRAARVQPDGLSDHRRIVLVRRRPETMCQDDDSRRLRTIVRCVDQSAKHRSQPHHVEVGPAHDARAHDARIPEAVHRERDRGEVAEGAHRFHACLEVVDLRDGERDVRRLKAGCALPDVDQAIFVTVRQRLEQDASNDAEDGGVRPDAQGQCQHDGDRQAPCPDQGAERKPEISHKTHRSSQQELLLIVETAGADSTPVTAISSRRRSLYSGVELRAARIDIRAT